MSIHKLRDRKTEHIEIKNATVVESSEEARNLNSFKKTRTGPFVVIRKHTDSYFI